MRQGREERGRRNWFPFFYKLFESNYFNCYVWSMMQKIYGRALICTWICTTALDLKSDELDLQLALHWQIFVSNLGIRRMNHYVYRCLSHAVQRFYKSVKCVQIYCLIPWIIPNIRLLYKLYRYLVLSVFSFHSLCWYVISLSPVSMA